MNIEYHKEYSHCLGRDMEFKVYGHGGAPMLVFPCQDGRFYDFEDRGMVQCAHEYIDAGRLQLFCCDSNDINSWSRVNDWDNRNRIEQHEAFYHYIVDELCPRIFDINAYYNGGNYAEGILTTGCSMGGSHALNFLLRRPDIFSGCIAMSGSYDARLFFPDYMDDLVYNNSPVDYLEGMPYDHPYVEMYRNRKIYVICGRGAWEHPMQEDSARLVELFRYKNIDAHVEFWGEDVAHDWPWWLKEFPYYLNFVC